MFILESMGKKNIYIVGGVVAGMFIGAAATALLTPAKDDIVGPIPDTSATNQIQETKVIDYTPPPESSSSIEVTENTSSAPGTL
jgi:hypothetical protein